jgi:hypothetical protein
LKVTIYRIASYELKLKNCEIIFVLEKQKHCFIFYGWFMKKNQFSWEPWNLVNALDERKSNELINLHTNTAISVFMVGTLKVEMREKKTLSLDKLSAKDTML